MLKRTINNGTQQTALVASGVQTASGNSGSILAINDFNASTAIVELTCSAASGTTPTLDVYIQETLDGTNWKDMYHFTQVTAALTLNDYVKLALGNESFADARVGTLGDATIAANTFGLPVISRMWRVKWVIGGTTPSFTFGVNLYYI